MSPPSSCREIRFRPLLYLFGHLRRQPLAHSIVALAVAGAALLGIAGQYQMKLLVDAMTGGDRSAAVWLPFLLLLAALGLENLCWRTSGYLGRFAFTRLAGEVRLDLFRHLIGHSNAYFADRFAGALAAKLAATGPAAIGVQSQFAWILIPACAAFLAALALLGAIDTGLALATAGCVCLSVAGLVWLGARGRPRHAAYFEEAAAVTGGIVDVLGNMQSVRAFGAAPVETEELRQRIAREVQAHRRSWAYTEHMRVLHDLLVFLLTGGVLAYAIHLWQGGLASAGDLVLVSTVNLTIIGRSREVAFVLVELVQQLGRVRDGTQTILEPQSIIDPPVPRRLPAARGGLRFEAVRFRYGQGRLLFEDLSLLIAPGQKVGILGRSGGGKSSLLGLVQRLHDLESGRILIDGTDIAATDLASLRRSIATVPQDIALFHRSIMDNIRYGRPAATEAEVVAAAIAAHADGFIRELPFGYATLVGERGAKLSGGQRQRIAIARAFLKQAPIILLDEATSALDSESEQLVQAALDNLVQGRTVLAVAHRLSSIAHFDRLLVIEEGRVLEDGSHAELLARDGLYAALWAAQSELAALPAALAIEA